LHFQGIVLLCFGRGVARVVTHIGAFLHSSSILGFQVLGFCWSVFEYACLVTMSLSSGQVQKFHIQQMELSFTQGRWDYQRWGALDPITSANAKPIGVELWAVFDVPKDKVDATWRNLTHALSGLFCASINFLESPAIVATPGCGFRPDLDTTDDSSASPCILNMESKSGQELHSRQHAAQGRLQDIIVQRGVSGYLRYGALPREAVCTENLTPWLKLLPCRDKAGLTTLLERPRIYNGHYHSLRIHLKSGEFNKNGPEGGTSLRQSLTLVLKPSKSAVVPERLKSLHSNWSLYLLFKKSLVGKCPLASSSQVHLELEGSLVKELQV
jgi:phosphatidylinositol glycan class T